MSRAVAIGVKIIAYGDAVDDAWELGVEILATYSDRCVFRIDVTRKMSSSVLRMERPEIS